MSIPIQLVLNLGLLAWMGGYAGLISVQFRILDPAPVPLMLLCVAGVVLSAAMVGLVNRLSSLGAILAGGCWLLIGLGLSFPLLGGLQLIISVSRELPGTLAVGIQTFYASGGALLVGGLVLAGGLGAAWVRRSRR